MTYARLRNALYRIADVAVEKRHQRLNEILIFLPPLHPGNQLGCLQEIPVMQ